MGRVLGVGLLFVNNRLGRLWLGFCRRGRGNVWRLFLSRLTLGPHDPFADFFFSYFFVGLDLLYRNLPLRSYLFQDNSLLGPYRFFRSTASAEDNAQSGDRAERRKPADADASLAVSPTSGLRRFQSGEGKSDHAAGEHAR